MVSVGLVVVLLGTPVGEGERSEEPQLAAPTDPEGPVAGEPAVDPETGEALTAGAAATSTAEDTLETRVKESRRSRAGAAILEPTPSPAAYGDPGVEPGRETLVGKLRPAVLRPRWPGGALALGGLVGFGTGYYYAGVPRWGLAFTLLDAVLVGGFVASSVMLNNLVVEHDFAQGKSLSRDERNFTKREQQWYAASILFALVEVGSRAFQAFGGLRAARQTNETLESFSFVPLGGGGAFELRLSW